MRKREKKGKTQKKENATSQKRMAKVYARGNEPSSTKINRILGRCWEVEGVEMEME